MEPLAPDAPEEPTPLAPEAPEAPEAPIWLKPPIGLARLIITFELIICSPYNKKTVKKNIAILSTRFILL